MLAALGGLASYAIPKLMTFAAKKLKSNPLGNHLYNTIKDPQVAKIISDIKTNYKNQKLMQDEGKIREPQQQQQEYYQEQQEVKPKQKKRKMIKKR